MQFNPLTIADVKRLQPYLHSHPFRSCDLTTGGLFLWADAFHYRYAIEHDTLFISGVAVNDTTLPIYSLPLGRLPLSDSLEILHEHSISTGCHKMVLSSVPEEALPVLIDAGAREVEQLADWSDYIYEADKLSTFAGKKLSKKRNHLNRFAADHPDATFRAINADTDSDALIDFYEHLSITHDSPMALYDRHMTLWALRHLKEFPFEGALLSTPENGIVAFTLGEAVADTLHVHIEKMNHEINGAGETICRDFTEMMLSRHPGLRWVNRQDDSGDMGLRRAKLALHPCSLLHKYNVVF